MHTHEHIVAPKAGSRPSTPGGHRLSRPGTPSRGSRPGTPSRLQADPSAKYMTKGGMPNNRELDDPRTQDRASDLLGSTTTEPVRDGPSPEEVQKARALAELLDKKKRQ
ncbi:hypothetical protein JCM3770_000622 [Rhodotorula araucariae]